MFMSYNLQYLLITSPGQMMLLDIISIYYVESVYQLWCWLTYRLVTNYHFVAWLMVGDFLLNLQNTNSSTGNEMKLFRVGVQINIYAGFLFLTRI